MEHRTLAVRLALIACSTVTSACFRAGSTSTASPQTLSVVPQATEYRGTANERPEILTKRGELERLMTWSEYVVYADSRASDNRFVALQKPLTAATSHYLYGSGIEVDDKVVSWVLVGDDLQGYRFIYDENADGKLVNDSYVSLTKRHNDDWEVRVDDGRRVFYIEIHPASRPLLRMESCVGRTGTILINASKVRFAILERWGRAYGLVVDKNIDGVLDLEGRSGESIPLSSDRVKIGSNCYLLYLDSEYRSIRLSPRPLRECLGSRPI